MDDIWIPFLDDEENYKLNPNAKKPIIKEIKSLNDYINTYGDIKNRLIDVLKKLIPNAFRDYILSGNNKIINILCHFKYIENIDSALNLRNEYYSINKRQRLNELAEYIKNNCTIEINQIIQTINKNTAKISTPSDVPKLYDAIGSTTKLDQNFDVDVNNRMFCFLYINGELLKSQYGEKHYDLINQYIKKNQISHGSYVDAGRYRDVNDIKKYHKIDLNSDIPIAWGHYSHQVAYIEEYKNVTLNEVVKSILENFRDLKKIYHYHFNEQTITRLAKKDRLI